jgi:integrase
MKQLVRLRMRPSRDGRSFKYMLDYQDESGKRRQISLGHSDKRKAERQRREKELEFRSGIDELQGMKLGDFLKDSLMRTKGQVRASTLVETSGAMKDFIRCIGDINILNVKHQDGEKFLRYCLDRGNSPGTAAKKLRHLKRLFQLALDRRQLEDNPLKQLRQPKIAKKKVHVYTEQECYRLIKAAQQYQQGESSIQWTLLIRMALCTGMRRGELLNAIWRDIDFARRTIDVSPKDSTKHTWEWHVKDTDRRTLPLTNEVIRILADQQAKQLEGYPYVFVPPFRYDHIQEVRRSGKWTVEKGRCPLNNFVLQFKTIRAKAAIECGTFHDLRKTCLSKWLTQGLSEFEVMHLAGHSKFETTHRFYLAVRHDLIDRAREASAKSIRGDFVAHLLRAPSEEQKEERLRSTSAWKPVT